MFVAFMLMWACTPSSLRPTGKKGATKVVGNLPQLDQLPADAAVVADAVAAAVPQVTPEAVADAVAQVRPTVDSLAARVDTAAVAAAIASEAAAAAAVAAVADSLGMAALADTAAAVLANAADASAKMKRDTSTMDSLELAIYKYNKVIDDSLRLDSLNRMRKNGIDAPVKYSARDSLTYEAGSGTAHLYGDSHVEYQNMDLKSDKIYMVLDSSLVHATGSIDTAGVKRGTPVFKMGSDEYESDTMAFNFKTKKGLISQVYTQQEDGFLTSELSKRGGNGELYLRHGRYTTCDEPHPDFYLALSRAKVRPGKDVIFGPAYLVVCDVPLPLAIPYGFFPFTKSYSSGFIMPTYGDDSSKGFYLRDGGYYFAISDKMDLKLTGEIFTKGSWAINANTTYAKRYKYKGTFFVSYQNGVTGEKNMPDYEKTTSFKVTWDHMQDAKANPFSNFSARVNFVTSSFEKNNLSSLYNPQALTQSTRTSSVSYRTGFSSIGMSITTAMNITQNMRDTTLQLSFPQMNVNIARFYPLRRKKMVGEERWYEKISMQYTGDFNNSINAKEDKVLHSSFSRDWQHSIKHSIPISSTFMLFDVLSLNPSFNFTAENSFMKVNKEWDTTAQKELNDTITGFYTVYNWRLNLTATTKLYGFYVPSRKLFGDKIQAIRHVFTPSITFSYAPDFSADRYGFYSTYVKTDKDGNTSEVQYSPYRVGSVSVPSPGKTGQFNFQISNNIEMKYRNKEDSLVKVSIIDELGASMSYNMAATRQPWSSLNTNLRLKLTKNFNINLNAVFASYVYEADSVGATPHESDNVTYWQKGKIGRFQGASKTFDYELNNQKISDFFKWLRGEKTDKKKDDKKKKDETSEEDELGEDHNIDRDLEMAKRKDNKKGEKDKADTDEDGYMRFSLPWNFRISYGINMTEDRDVSKFNYETMRYPYKYTQTLNFGGNIQISDGWNIQYSSGYDFENKKVTMTTASLSRDLHCFNMSCSVTLVPYTSYNFSFRCNAATLTDALKYDKRSGSTNAVQWY